MDKYWPWILSLSTVCFIVLLTYNPVNNLNFWNLQRRYEVARISHPENSVLLAKKKYFGGSGEYDSSICRYFVGEIRSAPLSKSEIMNTYENDYVAFRLSVFSRDDIPIKILFPNEPVSLESPYWDWGHELNLISEEVGENTVYLVYAGIKGDTSFRDLRCRG